MEHPTLRRGDTGDDVTYLQTLLCDVGETLKADGKFGDKTEKAVKDFQILSGLTPDGIVGPKTWDALEKATNEGWGDVQPGENSPEPPTDDAPVSPAPDDGNEYVLIPKRLWNIIKASAVMLHDAVRDADAVG